MVGSLIVGVMDVVTTDARKLMRLKRISPWTLHLVVSGGKEWIITKQELGGGGE